MFVERLTRLCMGKTEANSDNCYYINIVEQQQGNKSKNNNSFKYVNLICALPNFCFESETINKFLFKAIINSKTWNEMRYKLVFLLLFVCCIGSDAFCFKYTYNKGEWRNHLPFVATEIWTRNIIKTDPTPSHNLCSLDRIVESTCNKNKKKRVSKLRRTLCEMNSANPSYSLFQ